VRVRRPRRCLIPERSGPNVRQRRIARRLCEWRKAHGGTQDEIGRKLGWSGAKLSRYERADQVAGPAEIIAVATILGISEEERDHMVGIAASAAQQDGWWRSYGPEAVRGNFEDFIETEADASTVCNVEVMLIPGLLQTAAYAAQILRTSIDEPTEALVETRRQLREQRQSRLDEDEPLQLHAVIHENALRLPVGDRTTMRQQLGDLLGRAKQANVTLQILPSNAGAYPHIGTAYQLLYFNNSELPAAYLDNLTDGIYLEAADDLRAYTMNFERLVQVAHDPAESVKLISRIRDEWT